MKLDTRYHGVLNYEKEDIITFKKGLPGFENLKNFILVPAEENKLFYILHSMEDTNVGIIVISPFNVMKDYEFDLNDYKVSELNIKNQKDIIVVNTVNLSSKIENITINLKAPIIINKDENIGEQLILDKSNYPIKYPLLKGEI
ncbi:flagellar assembly protein FliW [Clostridium sp. JN-1]|jgi:flagellar assembly factor FliW|uniref:flagellar assembly protein FliW n=1 Tax=Clostridium sp. JN-1 TaxID=2483110 RepID=UPI000F0B097A|nr:flagellar assembly protein FliW [Clostridium sp. JN-1]